MLRCGSLKTRPSWWFWIGSAFWWRSGNAYFVVNLRVVSEGVSQCHGKVSR